jgi:hypothetical protein
MTATLEIRPGDAPASDVRDVWAEVLAEAASPDSPAHAAVAVRGADPSALAGAPVDVAQRDGSIGLTLLVEVVAPVTAFVLQTLWDDFVRPRLRDRFGYDPGSAIE